ncbi:MAG: hypothetical protein P8188_08175 [Gemmatimonadota bacterium]
MTPDTTNDPSDGDGRVARRLSGWSLAVAIAVLVGFGLMVAYVVGQVGADETTWTRLAWLLSSVEAIAFGAAGAVFGASVQRDRAVAAERRAEDNQRDAVAGRTLAESIKADARRSPPPGGPDGPAMDLSPPGGLGGAKSAGDALGGPPMDPHVELARRLFPD